MKKKIYIAILVIIGIITTIKLTFIYYNANFNPYALASFCSVSDFIDCDGIAKTIESQFLGIPLACWGMFLYLFILLMLFVDKLKNIRILSFLEVFKNPMDYIASLGLISFLISMSLLTISLFKIEKLCVLCAFTYILNLAIGCIAADFQNGGFVKSIKQSFIDFYDAIKIKKYLIALTIVLIAVGAFLTYTSKSLVFAPQVKKQLPFKEFTVKKNKYAIRGNLLGAAQPEVIVYVFSDYQCPICASHNIMMHKLAKEIKGIQIIHKNLPLDTECNVYLGAPMHVGACLDAKYAIAAEKQGNLWEMNDILFEFKPKSEQEILRLAEKTKHFDLAKLQQDANSIETYEELSKQIDEAYKLGIVGTPTTMINNKHVLGIKEYKEYVEWIEKK